MILQDFSDSALLIAAHGTSLDPASSASVSAHAVELRSRHIFAEVREVFWKQQPRLLEILPVVRARRVFMAPFFISEGYFCERVIPEALGFDVGQGPGWARVQVRGGQTWYYCRAVGTHPGMAGIALHRAREVVEKFPFPRPPDPGQTSLFIAGHGTEREENSRDAVEQLVGRLRAFGIYHDVQAVYLEESPRIGACYELAHTRNIVLVPFFAFEGPHVKKDIPAALGQPEGILAQRLASGQTPWRNPTEKHGKLLWYAPPVGTDPRLADIILDRVREAAEWGMAAGE